MAIGKVIGRVAIKVLPDTSDFREKTANDLRRIEKQLGNLEVDVIPEIDKQAKEKLKAELKAWAKELNLTVKVDLDLNDRDIVETIAELEALTKQRKVQIAPELDNGAVAKVAAGLSAMSGFRFLRASAAKFRAELMSLDKAVPKIAVVSHAVAGLGAWILGASGNLFSLSSSLSTIGQAGLALPGIFGGIAIGLATTIAALKDFNTQVPQASRYVHELQDTISQNFWEKAAAPIRNLVDKLFPILNKALAGTSTALGGFFAKLAGSATNLLLPKLTPMFDALTKSIQIASQYTDAFVGIIEKLGSLGSSYLPSLAKWFGDISARFDNFLAKAEADGSLKGWVDEGIVALKQLGSVSLSLTSIFHSIAKAAEAAGGSTLASLSTGLKGIADAAASPGFQNGLTDTLRAAYDLMGQIANIAGPNVEKFIITMSKRFQALGPTIGDTIGTAISAITGALASPAVTEGLTAMFEGFNGMVHSLAPAMEPLMQKFSALGKLIGVVAENLGVVLAAAIESLAPIFAQVAEALVPVISMLGPMLAGVIKALAPVFAELGDQLAKAATALQPLFAAVQKLITLLMPVLVPVLKIIVSVLGDALMGVIQGVTWVIEGLVKIVQGVTDVFKGFGKILKGLFTLDFGMMWDGLKQVFSGLGQILLGALQAALGAVWAYMNGTVLGFFKKFALKLLGPVMGPLGKIFDPIIDAGKAIWKFIKPLWDKIVNLFRGGGGGGGILAAVKSKFEPIVNVVKTVFSIIKVVVETYFKVLKVIFETYFKVIWTVVKTAFKVIKTLFETYVTVWKTIFTTVWDAIRLIFTTAWTAIRTFLQTTMDALYFLFKGPWDAIVEFFGIIFTQIRAAFTMAWTTIRTFLSTEMNLMRTRIEIVWDAIKGFFTGAWNAIKSIFTSALTKVKSLANDAWQWISTKTTNLWNKIKTFLTNAWTGIKTVFSNAVARAKEIVGNAWSWVQSKTSGIWNSIKSILSGAWSSIKSTVSSGASRVKSLMSDAWNTIKSTVSEAWTKIKGAVTDGITKVKTEVGKLPGKAKAALAGIGSILINAGSELIGGFIQGIKNKFDDVKGVLGDLTGKLTSWKGPENLDKVLLTPAGRLIIDGLIKGFEDRFTAVRSMLTNLTNDIAGFVGKSMSQQISDALSFAINGEVGAAITADAAVQGVNLDRRLGGLERQVTTAARSNGASAVKTDDTSIHIDNITIPLEDLAQLKDLEEFLDMLRVRTRQG